MLNLNIRKANSNDKLLYFKWANEEIVRQSSFNQQEISWDEHVRWFEHKINDKNCVLFLFTDAVNSPVGQIRFEKKVDEVVIGISIDRAFRGLGLGTIMLDRACKEYRQLTGKPVVIIAYVKVTNTASLHTFEKAGFENAQEVAVNAVAAVRMTKTLL